MIEFKVTREEIQQLDETVVSSTESTPAKVPPKSKAQKQKLQTSSKRAREKEISSQITKSSIAAASRKATEIFSRNDYDDSDSDVSSVPELPPRVKMPRLSYESESESESATATALKEALLQVEMLQKKLKMSRK